MTATPLSSRQVSRASRAAISALSFESGGTEIGLGDEVLGEFAGERVRHGLRLLGRDPRPLQAPGITQGVDYRGRHANRS